MSEFQYLPYRSPYTGSISDLMMRPAEAQGQAAITGANAWAQAAQGVGQAVSQFTGTVGQLTDPRRQMEQQQLNTARAAQKFDTIANQIQSTMLTQNPDGSRTLDPAKFVQAMSAQNVPATVQAAHLKSIDDINTSVKTFNQDRIDHGADLAHSVLQSIQAGADPETALAGGIAVAKANNVISDAQLGPLRDAVANGADITTVLRTMRSQSEKYKDVSKPVVLPDKAKLVNPDAPAGTAPLADNTDPNEGGYTINGQRFTRAGVPLGPLVPPQTPAPSSTSQMMRLVSPDGKTTQDVPISVVPTKDGTGSTYHYLGQDVSGRVRAIPPASVTIHNQNAQGLDLPAWALDDSRPTGAGQNVLEPSIRMTPNGLHQAALNYIANGQFPPTGRGTDPIAVAQRAAITSKVGAIASASGMDEPALRAFYKSNASSLTAEQKMSDAVQGFMATADKNAALLATNLTKIPDIGSPIFNKPLRAFASSVSGDPNMSQFATYLQSVQNEYGRIISQPNLAGQLTDSARREAESLIDPKATVPQIIASVQALTNEGTNRLVSVGEQIQRIQQRLQGPNAPATSAAPPAAASVAPQEGTTRPITDPGYPPGAEQTYRNGKWVRTR